MRSCDDSTTRADSGAHVRDRSVRVRPPGVVGAKPHGRLRGTHQRAGAAASAQHQAAAQRHGKLQQQIALLS